MPNVLESANATVNIVVVLLVLAIIVALIYYGTAVAKWLGGLYDSFTAPGGQIETQITNMFTPHQDDGTVAAKDVPLESADPVDWLFMDHDASAPI
jgi:uncharacterized protein involved in cysteine biosynthesis